MYEKLLLQRPRIHEFPGLDTPLPMAEPRGFHDEHEVEITHAMQTNEAAVIRSE
jgi:hypothetical protein